MYKDENFTLHYQRPSANKIILWGKNQYQDSIYVVLDKRDKIYPLYVGRKENLVVTP